MKRYKLILLIFVLLIGIFCCACQSEKGDSSQIKVVCAGFAEYDWTRNITNTVPDRVSVTYLFDDGSDPHSFQPSISDIASVSDCDVFVYFGGTLNTWSDDVIKNAKNEDMIVVCLSDLFNGELLEASNSSCYDEDGHEDEDHGHVHSGTDEHLWLSLLNAKRSTQAICDALCKADPENESNYISSTQSYINKITDLHEQYLGITSAKRNVLVFADRFPFAYLARDYKLDFYSAFSGCSAESELSQERIVFLANKIDELGLSHICIIETSDERLAKTVIAQSKYKDVEIIRFNSCQSINKKQVKDGVSYLGIMEDNLESFKKAIGE